MLKKKYYVLVEEKTVLERKLRKATASIAVGIRLMMQAQGSFLLKEAFFGWRMEVPDAHQNLRELKVLERLRREAAMAKQRKAPRRVEYIATWEVFFSFEGRRRVGSLFYLEETREVKVREAV